MPPRKSRPRPSNVKLTPKVTAIIVIALILTGMAVYTFGLDSRLSTAGIFNGDALDSGCIASNVNSYVESVRSQIPDKDRHTWIHLNVERLGYVCSSSNNPGGYEDFLRATFPDNGAITFPVDGILKGYNPWNPATYMTPTPTPTPTPQTAIKIISNIPAKVQIDTVDVGTTGDTFTVSPGGHDIKVFANGYTTYTTRTTAQEGITTTIEARISAITPVPTTPEPTQTPAITQTPTVTITAIGTGTPTPTSTPSNTKQIPYKNFVIIIDNGVYFVDGIPHDSIKDAKATIDEMVAENESPAFPTLGAVGGVIAVIAILWLAKRRKK